MHHDLRIGLAPRSIAAALAAIALLLAVALPAHAASIVFTFEAQINGGSDPGGLLAPVGGLNLGSTISGFFVLDDTVADANASSTLGRYPGAIIALAVDLGPLDYVYNPLLAGSNDAFVLDDQNIGGFPSDGYSADVLGAPASLGATAMDSGDFHFSLASSDTLLWGSDAIPAAQPTAQAGVFDRLNEFRIIGSLGVDTFQIDALITQVPEPGTGTLLAAGLAGLGFARRRRDQ